MDLAFQNYTLQNLGSLNVILGKNGCGKSTLLKAADQVLSPDDAYGRVSYITPERGGTLVYEAGVESNVLTSTSWMSDTRRQNQGQNFRQQTVSQYRTLETQTLRLVQSAYKAKSDGAATFDEIIDKINSLLDNIRIAEGGPGSAAFKMFSKSSGEELNGTQISSGESELISLAIECLVFSRSLELGRTNVLLLDEPDVHLHPDLQARLTRFLRSLVETHGFVVVMATHSTAMLGDLADSDSAAVALMRSGDTQLVFTPIDDTYRRILPVFGAHPLSNVFNASPLLLLEGEDDVRIWQQVVRSSNGKVKIYPVDCGSVSEMAKYETLAADIVNAVYDDAKTYSLRDRDDGPEEIDNHPPVFRMRLHCRAAENLMLSDDVLAAAGTDWEQVQLRIEEWLEATTSHPKLGAMRAFRDSGFDRLGHDLKDIRMLLVGTMLSSNKAWEVLVGQAIATMTTSGAEHGLDTYLGEQVCRTVLASLAV